MAAEVSDGLISAWFEPRYRSVWGRQMIFGENKAEISYADSSLGSVAEVSGNSVGGNAR